jgi:hypothetical protein
MSNLSGMVTKEDIYRLGRNNPIVGQCISMHENSGLDWSAALAIMVVHLAEANKNKDEMLMKWITLAPMSTTILTP